LFLNLGYATYTYYDASTRTERELEAFRMNGTIDTEYIDIFGLKSDFRSMMKAVSYYLFGSILKLFKVRRPTLIELLMPAVYLCRPLQC
jgi:hypothetical protein